jgi:hypothetical protein
MAEPQYKPLGLIRLIIAIGAILLLASVFLRIWAVQHAPEQRGGWNYLTGGNKEYVIWAPLEKEKALYREAGYSIDFMDGPAVEKLRIILGPYAIIFELFALRFYGLLTILPLVLFTCLFGFCEGRIIYHEKIASFGNLSATRFKLFTLLAVFCFALCFIYLSLPFGSELPFIGTIPLTTEVLGHSLWTTAPYAWAVVFSVLMFCVAHQITGNLAREI